MLHLFSFFFFHPGNLLCFVLFLHRGMNGRTWRRKTTVRMKLQINCCTGFYSFFFCIFLSISWVLRILWFSFSDIYLMSKKKWDWIWQYELWSELILYELRFTKKIVKLEKSFVYIWNGIFAIGKKRYEKRFIFSWYKCIEDGLTHTKMNECSGLKRSENTILYLVHNTSNFFYCYNPWLELSHTESFMRRVFLHKWIPNGFSSSY